LSTQEREVKLGVEQMSLIGNTVRLKAEFKDFNGEHVSPENVVLRIYNGYKQQVVRTYLCCQAMWANINMIMCYQT